jgi:hypothetical protein
MTTLTDLMARWGTDEGKPYKGRLIDLDAYNKNPNDIGCMCAQGQVLHLIGGWSPRQLVDTTLSEADKETAKLLNISQAHAALLRIVNDRRDGAPASVITAPRAVLGEKWWSVLDFWHYIDNMGSDEWAVAEEIAWDDAGHAAWAAARAAAQTAAEDPAAYAAWEAAYAAWAGGGSAVWAAARATAAATAEIQGSDILRDQGKAFVFLPAFGFASPDDIPPRPADYGIVF